MTWQTIYEKPITGCTYFEAISRMNYVKTNIWNLEPPDKCFVKVSLCYCRFLVKIMTEKIVLLLYCCHCIFSNLNFVYL